MIPEAEGAKNYFDRVPSQWDAFYSHENRLMYLVNRILRRGMFMRYKLTFQHCGDLRGATVLDIGCGTGRYSIECAKRGAKRVVGIDFAPHMIEFTKDIAEKMGVSDVCEFIQGDFMGHQFDEKFDVVLGLGLFDYIKDAAPLFRKVAQLEPRSFIASFPKFTPFWGTQRKIRYNVIKKCPIYNYKKEQLDRLYTETNYKDHKLIPCSKGYVGVGSVR
jgi:ubiquinone/menaquinone biosynthesis C-methylase UbiE